MRDLTPSFERVASGVDFWTARCPVGGLLADSRYSVRPFGTSGPVAAIFRTLPARLNPDGGPGGFTVLLGSCFSMQTGKSRPLGSAVRGLGADLFPHVKLLCGDQVYLDLPVTEDLPHNLAKLRVKLASKYLKNWNHDSDAAGDGFGSFLSLGANLFSADDHEFWNNYPYAQAHLPITYSNRGRRNYAQAAHEMFRAFQAAYGRDALPGTVAVQTLTLGKPGGPGAFELKVLDGRFFRDNDAGLAHRKRDLDHVVGWLRELKQPGCLVLSQPLFDEPAGRFRRRFFDAWLANYDDYRPLCEALDRAPHDVLLLSGDIHHARYAVSYPCAAKQNTLHEVVSSPLSRIRGKHHDGVAHDRFPDPPVPGLAARSVETRIRGTFRKDNFCTLAFRSRGKAVTVDLTYWSLDDGSAAARREDEAQITLY